MVVEDRCGGLAEIAAAMRDAGVSIESFIQRGDEVGGDVVIALVTHAGPARAIHAALDTLAASDHVVGAPMQMPILTLSDAAAESGEAFSTSEARGHMARTRPKRAGKSKTESIGREIGRAKD